MNKDDAKIVVEFAIGQNFVRCPVVTNGVACEQQAHAIPDSTVVCPRGHRYVTKLNPDLAALEVKPTPILKRFESATI